MIEETREQHMVESLRSVDKRDPLTARKATISTRDLDLKTVKVVVVVEEADLAAVEEASAATALHQTVVAVMDLAAVEEASTVIALHQIAVAAVVAVVPVVAALAEEEEASAAIALHQTVVVVEDLAEVEEDPVALVAVSVAVATKQPNNCNIYIRKNVSSRK